VLRLHSGLATRRRSSSVSLESGKTLLFAGDVARGLGERGGISEPKRILR